MHQVSSESECNTLRHIEDIISGCLSSRRVVVWLIPSFLALHNAEEAIAFRHYLPLRFDGLSPFMTAFVERLTYDALSQALWILSVAAFLLAAAVMIRPGSIPLLWALLALEATVCLNVLAHVVSAVFVFRGYAPGLVTALLVNAPFGVYCFKRVIRERWLSRTAVYAMLPAAILLHGPLLAGSLLALSITPRAGDAQAIYRAASVDSSGQLRIVLSNGQVIQPAKDSDQVAFDQVFLSADHRTAGWLALYPNCCTTYPIPLKLFVLRAGGRPLVVANELPIWQWAFSRDGQHVVVRQAPVHGLAPAHYELRDARTGRVIASADVDSAAIDSLPVWVPWR